jgi:F0F1-type ATP synthase epsilon subunit
MILEIVSPEATLFKGEVTSVSLPGVDGSFQITIEMKDNKVIVLAD